MPVSTAAQPSLMCWNDSHLNWAHIHPGTCAWPWQWESALAPFPMTDICSIFSLSNFPGMFLNNLRKVKMIRAMSKKTEAPETSLA